jgi:hypothetical protein
MGIHVQLAVFADLSPRDGEQARRGLASILGEEFRQRIEQWGAAQTREVLARMTFERSVRLTSMAWDAIEVADLDELAFLLGALCVGPMGLEVHHAV